MSFKPFTLNLSGRLAAFDSPAVMGVLNVTPDSFYGRSRMQTADDIARRVEQMVGEGVDIIDVGGYSTRPGALDVAAEEETERVCRGLEILRRIAPDVPVSVDTFRVSVAKSAIECAGAVIINDISGGTADAGMFAFVAEQRVPYVLMHMRGTPSTMSGMAEYKDVAADVIAELSHPLRRLQAEGVSDVIVDPGFGFAKTMEQNYELMRSLDVVAAELERPLLAGISRKSMITALCRCTPDDALPGTAALNMYAMLKGASILRVHDVAAARQCVEIFSRLEPDCNRKL